MARTTLEVIERNNIHTVWAAALCVSGVAIGTGSLHCLWGLLILLNISFQKRKS